MPVYGMAKRIQLVLSDFRRPMLIKRVRNEREVIETVLLQN
jgi:hypothetical protein